MCHNHRLLLHLHQLLHLHLLLQAVNAAFHQAAADLPFMPLKFPAVGDFNNEEVRR